MDRDTFVTGYQKRLAADPALSVYAYHKEVSPGVSRQTAARWVEKAGIKAPGKKFGANTEPEPEPVGTVTSYALERYEEIGTSVPPVPVSTPEPVPEPKPERRAWPGLAGALLTVSVIFAGVAVLRRKQDQKTTEVQHGRFEPTGDPFPVNIG